MSAVECVADVHEQGAVAHSRGRSVAMALASPVGAATGADVSSLASPHAITDTMPVPSHGLTPFWFEFQRRLRRERRASVLLRHGQDDSLAMAYSEAARWQTLNEVRCMHGIVIRPPMRSHFPDGVCACCVLPSDSLIRAAGAGAGAARIGA